MSTSPLSIHSTVPVVSTADVQKSIAYYTRVPGFSPDFEYGNPVVYAGVKSGEAEIYLTYDPGFARAVNENKFTPEVFIWVPDAGSLYNHHIANGAEIVEPISERPWGAMQYVIKDINGYHLKIAQPM